MSIYLHDIPLDEAWQRLRQSLDQVGLWRPLEAETVPLEQALDRVTASPVMARLCSPHYHAAAMDGYALRAIDTAGATDRNPVELQVGMQAVYLDTGDCMPDWADAVVPIEQVEPDGETVDPRQAQVIRLRIALAPWTHVRPMGEDIVTSELVLPAGHTLRPVDLGAIAGSGHDSVLAWRKPRVAILPTGSELVTADISPKPGEIIEYNSLVLAAQVASWGGQPTRLPIVPDDFQRILTSVVQAAQSHDLVLIIAGSSAGSEDFTARVVETLGRLLVHGVAVRPGHPVVLGLMQPANPENLPQIRPWLPVIGVPGYPVSAALTGEIFVEPLLACWLGRPPSKPQVVQATITRKVHSSLGDDEFLRVALGKVGDRWVAAPLSRGAGVITSLVRADGIVLIPAGTQGLEPGEAVDVRLYRSSPEIERTIVILGSHDLTIDLLAQFIAEKGARLTSANVGSLGGLIALSRGEAHVAGCHLLDPESGDFNLPYVAKYLPNRNVTLVTLVERSQGLLIRPGNPKGLKDLTSLAREDVTFINRQRGAGTRLLLDHHLGKLGIDPAAISGYNREEYTHLALAAAIASGRADCGLGIQAASAALGLDFVPLFQERYDLVIPQEHYQSPQLQPLLQVLADKRFLEAVQSLPGYDTRLTGKVAAEVK